MARPTSKVMVNIGLLNIPVRVYSATREHDTPFRMLHGSCMTPAKKPWYCPTHDEQVEQRELVRAVEVGKDTFLPISDSELSALPLPSAGAVHVEGFLDTAEIPQARRQKINYLGPDRGGDKGYALLHRVLTDTGKVAVGKVALRGNEQLVTIEPGPDGVLVLVGLWWTDEVIECDPVEFGVTEVALKEQEIALGCQIAQGLVLTTHLDAILDESEEALRELIERKQAGEVITEVERQAAQPDAFEQVMRLMLEQQAAANTSAVAAP